MTDDAPQLGPRADFSVSCIVDAPRERVFAAYTDPAAIPYFWAPEGVIIPPESVELVPEPGGAFNMVMMVNDDSYPMTGTFSDIVEPEFVQFVEPGLGIVCTISFNDMADGRTEIVVLQTDVPEEYRGEMAEMGWESSFNRLKGYLA
jgi:uncharacterized protein YndB with AHSA1/START domain